jgi:antitoxin component YwqK of YwqJK toxin-antitoxin module
MKHYFALSLIVFAVVFSQAQTVDAQGKKQGYWKKIDEKSNKLIYEGMFKDDKPVGVFKYYYPFDTVKAIIDFKADGRTSYAKLFHPNGKLMAKGKYIGESIKDSVWLYYDETGTLLSKDSYALGKKNGTCYVYLPDGKVSEERNYKADLQHGPFKQYFDGKKIKGEGTYVNGKMEGKNAYYYPNGVPAALGYYKNGNKTGPWIYKNMEGKITEKELYLENGNLADPKKTEEFFNKNKPKDSTPAKDTKPATKPAGKKG